jgi:hypothetical protein
MAEFSLALSLIFEINEKQMHSAFVIDGDTVNFDPMFEGAEVVVKPGTIRASLALFKIQGKGVCRLGDESSVVVSGCIYTTTTHKKPGAGTLTIQALDASQHSQRVLIEGQHALLKGGVLKACFQVTQPACKASPGNPPDIKTEYRGTARFGTTQSLGKAESEAVAGGTEEAAEQQSTEPVKLKLRIQDPFGPAADEPFTLTLAGVPQPVTGQTDATGLVTCQIPRTVRTGRLELGTGLSVIKIALKFEDFPPVEEQKGQVWRLQNLGFTMPSQGFTVAVKAFQEANQLTVNGTMDKESQDALLKAHGC